VINGRKRKQGSLCYICAMSTGLGRRHILNRIAILVPAMFLIAILVPYLKTTLYTFPEARQFAGPHWYNPYAGLGDTLLRANFHAHSRCWWDLTHGEDTEEELVSAYRKTGYHIPGISNYQSISTYHADDPFYISVYEHGVNAHKIHALVLGADRVSTTNFPLHFSAHQTQQMLDAAGDAGSLVALAHPVMGRLSMTDMRRLSGYELMEVGNTLGMSLAHWDAGLSAGRPVWILCNDDTHSLESEEAFIKWNMIYADQPTGPSALDALRAGRHYGVESYDTQCDPNRLLSVTVQGDSLTILVDRPVNQLNLYGQGGVRRVNGVRTNTISYLISEDDTYLRTEVHQDHCVWYLNPVVRTGTPGMMPVMPEVKIDVVLTWVVRSGVGLLILSVLVVSWQLTRAGSARVQSGVYLKSEI
jgi:hypothetical protein